MFVVGNEIELLDKDLQYAQKDSCLKHAPASANWMAYTLLRPCSAVSRNLPFVEALTLQALPLLANAT